MYFRIKVDAVNHARNVYSTMDWLGDVGGIKDFLMEILVLVFGGYIQFNGMVQTYESL